MRARTPWRPHSGGSRVRDQWRSLGFHREYAGLRREFARLRHAEREREGPVAGLLRDGIAVVPEFFTSDQVERLRAAIPPIDRCRLSPEGTLTRFFSDARTITALSDFFDSAFIADTMRAVLGPSASMHRSTVQYRTAIGHTGAFEQFFHIDTWRPRYKAFLYLTDVDEDNGPFTYTPQTHYGAWRYAHDREIARVFQAGPDGYIYDESSAYVGCFWPHEHARLCTRLGTAPRTVTGRAGTLLMFDARGLHKILPLRRAPRIILSSYWIREGQHA